MAASTSPNAVATARSAPEARRATGAPGGGPGAQHQSHQDGGGDDQAQGGRPRRPDPAEKFCGQGRSELDGDGTPSDQDNSRGAVQGPVRGHRPIVGFRP